MQSKPVRIPTYKLPENRRHNEKLSDEMSQELLDTFLMLDVDGEGKISCSSFRKALKCYGLEPSELTLDRLQAGSDIDLSEYMTLLSNQLEKPGWCYVEIQDAFTSIDHELKGQITFADVKRFFYELGEKLTDAQIDEQMRNHNINLQHDTPSHTVHCHEFAAVVMNNPKRKLSQF
eukprot:gene12410-26108_t